MLARCAPRLRFRLQYGLTLVEALSVVSIVGVLAALLLPAVQAAREAARRTTCQNRLRQIGLAMARHEDAHQSFPIGCIGCRFRPGTPGEARPQQRFLSWNIQVLPFMEQDRLWSRFDLSRTSYQSPNRELGAIVLPVFLCPSTSAEAVHTSTGLWRGMACSDFAGIYGVEGEGRTEPDPTSVQWLKGTSLGAMLYERPVYAKHIVDGLSRTALVGEVVLRRVTESEWANGQNVFAQEASTPINRSSGLGNEIGSPHPHVASVVFCDRHVASLHEQMEQSALNALLTKAGDEEDTR